MPLAVFVPASLNDLSVDVAISAPAQGDLLYRGATKWNNLTHGNTGDLLQSLGAGANPAWQSNASVLANAAIINPGASARNVITPTGDFIPLTLQASVGQTQPMFQISTVPRPQTFQIDTNGHVGIMQAADPLTGVGINIPSAGDGTHGVDVFLNVIDDTTLNSAALFFNNVVSHPTGGLDTVYGSWGYARNASNSVTNPCVGVLNAVYGLARQIGTGIVDDAIGIQAEIFLDPNSGRVNQAQGFESFANLGANSNLTLMQHYYVAGSVKGAGAVFGVEYGYYCESLFSAANSYCLYSVGTTTPSYHAGRFGINQDPAAGQLHVTAFDLNTRAAIFQAAANPTVNIIECRNGAAGVLFDVAPLGNLEFRRKDSTTEGSLVGGLVGGFSSIFGTNTHASYSGSLKVNAADFAGVREGLRVEGTGSAPALVFYGGATAVVKNATVSVAATDLATSETLVNLIRTVLMNLNLMS